MVLVSGTQTQESQLSNSVLQGTGLGPPLWTLFYKDSALSVRLFEFTEVVVADDFNAWRDFEPGRPIGSILVQCRLCQSSLYRWGVANSVKFDADKQSVHVLHRTCGHGDGFRLIGLTFGESLRMKHAMIELAREAG